MKKVFLLVLVLGLLVVPSTSLGAGKRVRATGGNEWNPKTKTIQKGQKVIWKNPTGRDHTVTAYGGGWRKDVRLDPGERTTKRFNSTGTYKYFCEIHGHVANSGACHGMCGKIRVQN